MVKTPFLGQDIVPTAAVNATAEGGTFVTVTLPDSHKPQAKAWQSFSKHPPRLQPTTGHHWPGELARSMGWRIDVCDPRTFSEQPDLNMIAKLLPQLCQELITNKYTWDVRCRRIWDHSPRQMETAS